MAPWPVDRPRAARMALLVAGAAAILAGARVLPQWPHDRTVHYVLGPAAPGVEELDATWTGEGDRAPEDFAREVRFRYARGAAPRVVTHEPRLRDGAYTVRIEIFSDTRRSVVERRVVLGDGVTSIDLAAALPPAPVSVLTSPDAVAR